MFVDISLKKIIRNKLFTTGLLLLVVLLFSWWSNPTLKLALTGDAWEYLSVARNFSHPAGEIRPIFYPFFIRLCMQIGGVHWGEVVVLLQMILHTITILFLYKLFIKFNTPNVLSFIFSLAIGFNPNLLLYSSKLLAQQILGVLIFFTMYFSIELIKTWEIDNYIFRNKNLYLSGIFSGLALITKLSWMLGIIPVVLTIFYVKKISKKTILVSLILISLHFSFNIVWSEYKKEIGNEKVYGIDSTSMIENIVFFVKGINFNDGAIRLGLVEHAKGTPLYEKLQERNLISLAKGMNGEVNENYLNIIRSLSWEERSDVDFAKAILRNVPVKYFLGQLSTWHTFFTKRMFSPSGFPGLPSAGKYIYIGSYYNLYRPLLPILLILFLALFKIKTFRPAVVLISLTLIYFSLLHALFTSSPQHFIYYRTSVEYILFFAALLPIGYLYDLMKPQLIYYYKQHIK